MALVNVRGQHSGLERFGIVLLKKTKSQGTNFQINYAGDACTRFPKILSGVEKNSLPL